VSLSAALSDAMCPFIIAAEDARKTVADLVAGQGDAFPAAVRRVANSCARISRFILKPTARVLVSDQDGLAPLESALAIGRHLAPRLSEAELAEIGREMSDSFPARSADDLDAWWSMIPNEQRLTVQGALGSYFIDEAVCEPALITWSPELFFPADRPDEPLSGPIDITGRSRCLLQGPDILPAAGRWSLSLAVWFSREAAEHEFLVEITGCEPSQQRLIRVPHAGQFEGSADIVIPEQADQPLNIRFSSLKAAFDGTVKLIGARLTPLSGEPGQPTPTMAEPVSA